MTTYKIKKNLDAVYYYSNKSFDNNNLWYSSLSSTVSNMGAYNTTTINNNNIKKSVKVPRIETIKKKETFKFDPKEIVI